MKTLSHRLKDHLTFEWPWVRALLLAALILIIAATAPLTWQGGLATAVLGTLVLLLATGATWTRKPSLPLLAAFSLAALAGATLPRTMHWLWIAVAVILILLVALLRFNHPYEARRIRPRQDYQFAGQSYTLPELAFRSRSIYFVREDVQQELMELAAYADRFLRIHQIRYVMCYGTLLGALRHGGPMPWDDDVDFTIYHPDDIAKIEESFESLAQAAAADGYHLFRHNDYWKIARKGFWRFPVVDLYRAAVAQPLDQMPCRISFGGLNLCIPADARQILEAYYGADCMSTVVFDIPFWDSGFPPAAVGRLLPPGVSNLLGDIYDRVFK